MSFAALAACEPVSLSSSTGADNTGQRIDPNAPVPVALLVPAGSGQASDALLAKNFENAARLAISDLGDVKVALTVYNTAGDPSQMVPKLSSAHFMPKLRTRQASLPKPQT